MTCSVICLSIVKMLNKGKYIKNAQGLAIFAYLIKISITVSQFRIYQGHSSSRAFTYISLNEQGGRHTNRQTKAMSITWVLSMGHNNVI